jgi:hypothetical protein
MCSTGKIEILANNLFWKLNRKRLPSYFVLQMPKPILPSITWIKGLTRYLHGFKQWFLTTCEYKYKVIHLENIHKWDHANFKDFWQPHHIKPHWPHPYPRHKLSKTL